jgi:hypothetical protein
MQRTYFSTTPVDDRTSGRPGTPGFGLVLVKWLSLSGGRQVKVFSGLYLLAFA